MTVEFDPGKDAANIAKHGISLSRAADFVLIAGDRDRRFIEERYRAYGVIDGQTYCLAYTFRGEILRAISLRRARAKELRRHVR